MSHKPGQDSVQDMDPAVTDTDADTGTDAENSSAQVDEAQTEDIVAVISPDDVAQFRAEDPAADEPDVEVAEAAQDAEGVEDAEVVESAASADQAAAESPAMQDQEEDQEADPEEDQEVAQPPASAAGSSDEAATPAEAVGEDSEVSPALDQRGHMISWIQHGGGKLPPSIAPAMPGSASSASSSANSSASSGDASAAADAESGSADSADSAASTEVGAEGATEASTDNSSQSNTKTSAQASSQAPEASSNPGGQLNAPATPLVGRQWSEPGQEAEKAVLSESQWPALRGGATASQPEHATSAANLADRPAAADHHEDGPTAATASRPVSTKQPQGAKASATTNKTRRRWLPLCAAAGFTLAAAWGGLAWWTTQHIASGTTISGVDLSGLSPQEATTRLSEQIGNQLSQPVTLTVGQGSAQLIPAESGISLDAKASVDKVTAWTLNPITIAQRLTGTQAEAVLRIDNQTLTGALEDRVESMANGAVSATVTLEGTNVVTTPAQDGVGLDVTGSVERLNREGWPLGQRSIAMVEGTAVPAITDAEVKAFVEGTLNPMLSANMTVTTAGTQVAAKATSPTVTLTPATTASLTTIKTEGGQLQAILEPEKLHETVLETLGDVEKPAIDASWTIDGSQSGAVGDKPQYVAPAQGMGIDLAALSDALTTTAAQGKDPAARTVTLPLSVLEPKDTTPESEWGVKEVVGEYSTPYNGGDLPRTQNLRRGAEQINGTVVKPGEVFSLEETLGEVDYEHGFADAGIISNGEHIDSLGGGLSQVATTVFNAGFEAGMDDTEHHPHQYYFDRYPAGREATLWTGKLDVKFTNSTPHAVLLQAWLDGEEIHVRAWSTKHYDVTITESERYNFRPVVTERKSGPTCTPYYGGNPGFDITVTRKRSHGSQTLPDDVLTTAYYPDNNIVCN